MSLVNGFQAGGLVSVSTAVRRAELQGIRTSCPVWPLPEEGLADLLFRASSENGYLRSSLLLSMMGIPTLRLTHAALAGKTIDLSKVADVLGLESPRDIASLVYPETRRGGTHVMFFGREVRKKTFFEASRRVSPLSLRKDLYQKVIWSVRGITFDRGEMEQLLTHCPLCEAPLSFSDSCGVETCASCKKRGIKTDFREHPQRKVAIEDEESLSLVISLVDPTISAKNIDRSLIHDKLLEFGPGQLFALISGMARFKNYCASSRGRKLDPVQKAREPTCAELCEATRAVINWPNGFLEYTEKLKLEYRQKANQDASRAQGRLGDPVRIITTSLDEEMQRYVISTAQSGRASRLFSSIGELISDDEGGGHATTSGGAGVWQTRIGKSGLRRLYAAVEHCRSGNTQLTPCEAGYLMLVGSRSARAFSTSTGIAPSFVTGLIQSNLIHVLDDTIDVHLRGDARPPLEKLEARIAAVAQTTKEPSVTMSLVQAISSISAKRLNPWLGVLPAILEGKLPIWVQPSRAPALMDRIRVGDFEQLRELLASTGESQELGDLPADVRVTMSILGLSKVAVSMMRVGRLLPEKPTFGAVWKFRDLHISGPEVQRRLLINGQPQAQLSQINREIDAAGISRMGLVRGRKFITFRERSAVEAVYGKKLADRV
ncbi:hypothetical protein ELH99_19420 [Rhizobium leguminosarum]|uniref:hypothetical protein n=1 Tax=Rhizobium leguminosarum TaxID=384 RepID=UPI001030F198|nr:hypothetical protein [Rhizobium leguminosarum]TAX52185.1 hypothetical protein ELH99_19420 [Rhizobium leguminosarum]